MAAKNSQTQGDSSQLVTALNRISNLLGLLATKDLNESDRIGRLNAVGFGNQEIARILEKDSNTIAVALSKRRKKSTKKKN